MTDEIKYGNLLLRSSSLRRLLVMRKLRNEVAMRIFVSNPVNYPPEEAFHLADILIIEIEKQEDQKIEKQEDQKTFLLEQKGSARLIFDEAKSKPTADEIADAEKRGILKGLVLARDAVSKDGRAYHWYKSTEIISSLISSAQQGEKGR